jgi:hypothetical protein
MFERAAPTDRLEQLEHGALLGRARKNFLALEKSRQVRSDANDTVSFSFGLWLRGAGQRAGSAVRSARPIGTM